MPPVVGGEGSAAGGAVMVSDKEQAAFDGRGMFTGRGPLPGANAGDEANGAGLETTPATPAGPAPAAGIR